MGEDIKYRTITNKTYSLGTVLVLLWLTYTLFQDLPNMLSQVDTIWQSHQFNITQAFFISTLIFSWLEPVLAITLSALILNKYRFIKPISTAWLAVVVINITIDILMYYFYVPSATLHSWRAYLEIILPRLFIPIAAWLYLIKCK